MNSDFFESLDLASNGQNIWMKFRPGMDQFPTIHSGYLKKLSKDGADDLSMRYFSLNSEYLLYKKTEDAITVASAMSIKHARLIMPEQDETDLTPANILKDRFALKLCFKSKFSVLFACNEAEHKAWIDALTRVAIRTDFHSRFSVSRIIGSGAFANVYEAADRNSGHKIAIKGFNKHYVAQESKGREGLWNEICLLRKFKHPNLLQLCEVHETKNSVYLVFDLLQGGELSKLLSERKATLKESDIINIVIGLLRGIECLDSKKIVHRDIKPSNILLRKATNIQPDDVVIVDFGLAVTAHSSDMVYSRCGTPGYIAPEIIGAQESEMSVVVSPKCDVFSVGVILYYLLFGKNPFETPNGSAEDALLKNMEVKIELPQTIVSTINKDLLRLLKHMLTVTPETRPSAKKCLQSSPFTQRKFNGEPADLDEFHSQASTTKTLAINAVPSFDKNPSCLRAAKENLSIGTNSHGNIDQLDGSSLGSSGKKQDNLNLYKHSLMRSKLSFVDQVETPQTYEGSNTHVSTADGSNLSKKLSTDSAGVGSPFSRNIRTKSPTKFQYLQSKLSGFSNTDTPMEGLGHNNPSKDC